MTTGRVCLLVLAVVAGCNNAKPGGKGLPRPSFTATPDYAGLPTALDGTMSSDPVGRSVTYTWHFVSVPTGSAVTDASFADPSALMTTFESDRGGTYKVALLAKAADGAINAALNDVVVPAYPIFYLRAGIKANSTSFNVGVIGSDGSDPHAIGCPTASDAGYLDRSDPDAVQISFLGGLAAIRTLEGPDPLFVFPSMTRTTEPSMGRITYAFNLYAATSQNTCNGRAPLRLDNLATQAFGNAPTVYMWPRFSPDGKRIVFLVEAFGGNVPARYATVGVDGSSLRVVRTIPTSNSTGPVMPPLWVDNNTIAWVENSAASSPARWKVMKAPDTANAGDTAATALLDCGGGSGTPVLEAINQTEVANGVLYVAGAVLSTRNGGALNIYRMNPGVCAVTDKLTDEQPGYFSGDFNISPNGTTLLFASSRGLPLDLGPGANGFAGQPDIYKVNAMGPPMVKRIAGDPDVIDTAPRFISGGKQILWTRLTKIPTDFATLNGPSSSSLWIANADGSKARVLLAGDDKPDEQNYLLSGGNSGLSCAWGGAIGGGFSAVGLLLVAIAIGLTRRRAG